MPPKQQAPAAQPNFSGMPTNFHSRGGIGGIGGSSLRQRTAMIGGSMAVMEPPWLKLSFSRDDAETYLERFSSPDALSPRGRKPTGSFVVRNSSQADSFSITVRYSDADAVKHKRLFFHGLLVKKADKTGTVYLLKGDPECRFKTLQDLVMFYCSNKSAGNPTMPLLRMPESFEGEEFVEEKPKRQSEPAFSGFATTGRQPRASQPAMSGSATLGRPSSSQQSSTMSGSATMGRPSSSAQSSTMGRPSGQGNIDLGAIFQPTLTRDKAEALVLKGPVGTFVIRNSSIQDSYSLIIHANASGDRRFYSPLILKEFVSNKITFHVKGEEGNRFTSLLDLAVYYSKNRSPVHPPMPYLVLPGQQAYQEEFGFEEDPEPAKTATVKPNKSATMSSKAPEPAAPAPHFAPAPWRQQSTNTAPSKPSEGAQPSKSATINPKAESAARPAVPIPHSGTLKPTPSAAGTKPPVPASTGRPPLSTPSESASRPPASLPPPVPSSSRPPVPIPTASKPADRPPSGPPPPIPGSTGTLGRGPMPLPPAPASQGYSRPPMPPPPEAIQQETYSYNNSAFNIQATISNKVVEEAIYEDEDMLDEPSHPPPRAAAPPPPVVPRAAPVHDIEEIIYGESEEEFSSSQLAPHAVSHAPPLAPRGLAAQQFEDIYGEDDGDGDASAFAFTPSAPAPAMQPVSSYEHNTFTHPPAPSQDFVFDADDITGFGQDAEADEAPSAAAIKSLKGYDKNTLIYDDGDDGDA